MRVGIIGAGAAGLAAAHELGKAGHQTVVYEGAPFLGGQASTFDVGGGRLERGYHHLFTSDTDIVDLIHELGLGHKMAWIESKVGIFYGGRIYDFVTPMDLLKFTPLSLIDRVRLGLVTLNLRRYKDWRKLEPYVASEVDSETRRQGRLRRGLGAAATRASSAHTTTRWGCPGSGARSRPALPPAARG